MVADYPADLLRDTLWDFSGQDVYPSALVFVEVVRQYHQDAQEYAAEIQPDECWQPATVLLSSPSVRIRYFSDSSSGEVWHEAELASDNGRWFTAGELLYKLHNAAVGQLKENGHRWFEGLQLESVSESGVPVYVMILGS